MKPLKLYMKNFKSYGEDTPVFDFDLFDIVLLTGENGNGKSSIADAITWCVWGQAKGMSGRSGIDDLVKTGALDMEVTFIFEEDQNEYKIIRKRDKKRGQSALELYIKRDTAFVPISGNRIDETQSKIESIIKLDYDTYLCTAYLSQGKADLFAVKKPNERKQILAEILNLSSYDKLEALASEKRNSMQNDLKMLINEMETLTSIAANKVAVEKDREATIQDLKREHEDEKEKGKHLEAVRRLLRDKQSLKKKMESYRENLDRNNKELKALVTDGKKLEERIDQYKNILKKEDNIREGYEKLQSLLELDNILKGKLQIQTELMRQKDGLEGKINALTKELEYNVKLIEQQMKAEQAKIVQADNLILEKDELTNRFNSLLELESNISNMENILADNNRQGALLKAEQGTMKKQLDELRERYVTLKSADSCCPLCESILNESKKAKLMGEAIIKGKEVQNELENKKKQMKNLELAYNELVNTIKSGQATLRSRGKIEARLAILDKQLEESQRAKTRLGELQMQLEPIENNLESKEYAKEHIESIKAIEDEVRSLKYSLKEHEDIKVQIKGLQKIPAVYEEMQLAKAKLSSDEENLERIAALIEDKKNAIKDLEALIDDIKESTKDSEDLEVEASALEKEHQAIQRIIRDLEGKRGALDERMRQIQQAETRIKGIKDQIGSISNKIELYKMLINVYSKKGIQAAIIENAIPELENETNRILTKITDGRLMVEFLTQRDTKSGSILETLDIKISDGMDTRKYETYSGGEEFRINFAIRIALSKILAHRAGANVRLLILDEGFGTLDEKGRERLAEVINAIRGEFEKIIVITHIQDLKDYFPTQIEVSMTPKGSVFKLVG